MKKNLTIFLTILFSVFVIGAIVYAANTFPTTLNDWEDGDIIESDWADSIEDKIGVDGSLVKTSLDWKIRRAVSFDVRLSGGDFSRISSLSFDAGMFNISNTASRSDITLDWTNGPASRSATNTWTALNTFNASSLALQITGNASASVNFEAVGYASASKYFGGGLTNCVSTSKLYWASATGLFACNADDDVPESGDFGALSGGTGITFSDPTISFDSTEVEATTWGAGGNATNIWTFNLSAGDPTLTWTRSGATLSLNFEVIGYASASKYFGATLSSCAGSGNVLRWSTTGLFSCGTLADADIPDTISLIGGTIGANNISGTQTTTGTTTFGDNGDNIVFDSNTWDISGAGVGSGFTGFTTTGTFDASGATLFKIISTGAPTINAAGEIAMNTTSNSFDWYNGTNQEVIRSNGTCFTYVVDSPTAANPGKLTGKRFNDPFTITSVQVVASGSNAAGWNLRYGAPGTVTTNVFTDNKSASTSAYPTYLSTGTGAFTNSTIADGNVLEVNITSRSAVLQTFAVSVCGRYNH